METIPVRSTIRRAARLAAAAVFAVLAIATVLVVGAWVLASRDPAWFPAPTAATGAEAEAVERIISDQIVLRRDHGAEWTIEVTEDAANAWLAMRLPLWLEHEGIDWPWPGSRVGARFDRGLIRLGVHKSEGAFPRVLGVSVVPTMAGPGRIAVRLDAAHIGAFAARGFAGRVAARWALDADHADLALGAHPVDVPVIRLDDDRTVEWIGIAPSPGRVRLTFRSAGGPTPDPAYHKEAMTDASAQTGPRTILFVCTGNTCRSPMAEAIARRVLESGGIEASRARISSAGAYATDGAPAAPEAIRAVARLGADLASFRSHALTPHMLSEADIILAMSASHVAAIVAMDPSAADRVYMLDPTGADIPDPLGASQAVYDQTAARLLTLIHRRLADLLGDVPDQTTGAAP